MELEDCTVPISPLNSTTERYGTERLYWVIVYSIRNKFTVFCYKYGLSVPDVGCVRTDGPLETVLWKQIFNVPSHWRKRLLFIFYQHLLLLLLYHSHHYFDTYHHNFNVKLVIMLLNIRICQTSETFSQFPKHWW